MYLCSRYAISFSNRHIKFDAQGNTDRHPGISPDGAGRHPLHPAHFEQRPMVRICNRHWRIGKRYNLRGNHRSWHEFRYGVHRKGPQSFHIADKRQRDATFFRHILFQEQPYKEDAQKRKKQWDACA